MQVFKQHNERLDEAMATHLISLEDGAVWQDNYMRFLHTRCVAISGELKKRVIPREVDKRGRVEIVDDTEDLDGVET